MPVNTVSIVSTRAVIEAAGRRGVEAQELLAPHGLTAVDLEDPDQRLPAQTVGAIWAAAVAASGEPELPVLAAVELPFRRYRVLDYLAGSAATVGQALELVARYFGIVNDAVRLPIVPQDDGGASLGIARTDGGTLPAPYVDYALAACVFRMSMVSEGPVAPIVHLRRPAPRDRRGHEAAFGPDLHFDADVDVAVFPVGLWRRPTRAPDPVLRDLLEANAQATVAALAPADPLADLRDAGLAAMRTGRTDLPYVARRLGTSTRTLQRRLAAHGTSWRELLEDLRFDAARAYLRDPALSVDDVAVLLGYAEASTFHRAFRRWSGATPGAWRRTLG